MNTAQNKQGNGEEKEEKSRYPYEFMALMITLLLGGIIIGLKIAGVF